MYVYLHTALFRAIVSILGSHYHLLDMKNPPNVKTWLNFMTHFRQTHQELRDTETSMSELGFHSTNGIVEKKWIDCAMWITTKYHLHLQDTRDLRDMDPPHEHL